MEETQRCIQSVLRYARDNITASRLIVINDASPDSALTHWLRNEAKKQPGFLLLENEDNLGFVGTVNRGMTQSATNDVLLLNSDTEVANQWLDRLHAAAYRGANVGTVTPFSNNATICSYPRFCQENSLPPNYDTATLDALFAATHPGASIEIPTGVGFCMYIRRDCLQQIGLFDAESFGKGYGEENDFCQRAIKAGWRNLHALDTFVRHTGSVSFGTTKAPLEIEGAKKLRALHPTYETQVHEFIQADPARPHREAVDMRRLDANPHPRVLAVTHSLGGGTLRHIHELAAHLKDHITVLSMMPMADHDILIQWVADGEGMQRTFNWQKDPHQMVAWLRQVGVVHVHYHHLLGISLSMMRIHENLGVSYDFTAHDYYAACPQVSLATEQQTYCGERGIEQCRVCVSKRPTPRHESIEDWRLRHSIFLTQARNVLAPSQDATARLKKYYPHANPRHVPHIDLTPQQIQSLPAPSPYTISEGANLRVLILGAISQAKGGNLLEEISVAAAAAQAPIEFHLVGYPHRQLKTQPEASLTIHGPYKDRNLVSLIQRLKPNLVWFPAQIPETYSYTLSACLVAGIPVAAPDLGAFPERLKHRPWTWIRPWQTSASQWLAFFMEIREKHFITGNAPPVAPGAVVADLPGDATPWSYTKDYLRFTRPITRTNDNSAP